MSMLATLRKNSGPGGPAGTMTERLYEKQPKFTAIRRQKYLKALGL